MNIDARREGLKICNEAPEKYPKNEDLASFKADFTSWHPSLRTAECAPFHLFLILDMAAVSMQNYPSISKDLLERNEQVIAVCNEVLGKRSATLEIKASELGEYGMFAKSDIRRGDLLLLRHCLINVSGKQLRFPVQDAECVNCCQPIRATGTAESQLLTVWNLIVAMPNNP